MKSLSRILLALALAVWVALPGVGSDGGENAGGTGVWILPRACWLNSGLGMGAPRDSRVLQAPLTADCAMMMSVEVGNAVATFVDTLSGVPVSLPVSGSLVRLPVSLLHALSQSPQPTANVLITDAAQVGYVIHISIDPQTGNATIRVM
jgi:hypothetical protein